ncbi:MAG: hypothetical protein LBB27_02545, partial [Tannerellaceae bacterium]|nr:hypothetical protein [Tannerellaceae bacterium]
TFALKTDTQNPFLNIPTAMTRLFNIAGPCNPVDHYILSPAARLPELQRLVDGKQYFLYKGCCVTSVDGRRIILLT